MKKVIIALLMVGLFGACSKESDDESPTPFGQWTQERYADNPQFNNAEAISHADSKIIVELNSKDLCRFFMRNPERDLFIVKSLCTITNESITAHDDHFSPFEPRIWSSCVQKGEMIVIYELTPQKMVLKWTTKQLNESDYLPQGTYYTELKRVK